MSIKNDLFKSKGALYGVILILISVIALGVIFAVRDGIIAEYEKMKTEEGCFQGDKPDPKWKELSVDERKAKSRKCMIALNKVTQINYGPYIFSITLAFGLFLLILSIINAGRNVDTLMEEVEDDNKLPE